MVWPLRDRSNWLTLLLTLTLLLMENPGHLAMSHPCVKGEGIKAGTRETDKSVGEAKVGQGEKDFQGPVIYTQ